MKEILSIVLILLYISVEGQTTKQETYKITVNDGLAGVLNKKGDTIVPFEYSIHSIEAVRNLGFIVTKRAKQGIIDTLGNTLLPAVYDNIDTWNFDYSKGYVGVENDDLEGIVSLRGETIIPMEFGSISELNGMINVSLPKPDSGEGLYDIRGNMILPSKYRWITDSETYDSKLTFACLNDTAYNILNKDGKILFTEHIKAFGCIIDQNKLLSTSSTLKKYLTYVQNENGKFGLLNEISETIDVPIIYDNIFQRFESSKNMYYAVQKENKFGLIDEIGKVVIPIIYDSIDINFLEVDGNAESEEAYTVVVSKENKFGAINFKNQIVIPFQYSELHRISWDGLYKAKKKGKHYQIINLNNKIVNKGPFDEVSNFEHAGLLYTKGSSDLQALTFFEGKMRAINEQGEFLTSEELMDPHIGYTTFDELKQALLEALKSDDNLLLKDFIKKATPTDHLLFFMENNIFDRETSLEAINISAIQDQYYKEILEFKNGFWTKSPYVEIFKDVIFETLDYTMYRHECISNARNTSPAYGNLKLMGYLLRNSIKVNGFWISTYFMKKDFRIE